MRETLTVGRDIDFHTGNIVAIGDVLLGGTIRSGFEVMADQGVGALAGKVFRHSLLPYARRCHGCVNARRRFSCTLSRAAAGGWVTIRRRERAWRGNGRHFQGLGFSVSLGILEQASPLVKTATS